MSGQAGIVYLVGAGPGAADLITVRGLRLLQSADVVLHDRLIDPALLLECAAHTEIIDVGKRGGDSDTQTAIADQIIQLAKSGRTVVRLKGGDPFLFGRGYEELRVCRDASIPCVVVPGVSSAIAAPELAGIPVTLRAESRSLAIITGAKERDGDMPPYDFRALAAMDTLVVLMGRSTLPEIVQRLAEAGLEKTTPVCCIERAARTGQRTITGTLANIADEADRAHLSAPVVTVIGKVAALAEQAGEKPGRAKREGPLAGRRVVVTQPRDRGTRAAEVLSDLGAQVVSCPLFRPAYVDTRAFPMGVPDFNSSDWVAFTSARGVKGFFKLLRAMRVDVRNLRSTRLAAVGASTARALERHGVRADLVPRRASASGLADTILALTEIETRKVLHVRGERAMGTLSARLTAAGIEVEEAIVYSMVETDVPRLILDEIEAGVDAVHFASPSAVERFSKLVGGKVRARAICIGDTTANTARAFDYEPVVAATPSTRAMIDATCLALGRTGVRHV